MFRKSFFLALTFLSFASVSEAKMCFPAIQCTQTACQMQCPSIRILIVNDVACAELGVHGQYSLYDPNRRTSKCADKYLSTRFRGKCRPVQSLACGLKWGEEFPDLYQLKIVDDKPESYMFVDGKTYKGPLYVYDIGGTVSIVNEIFLEDYVLSALSGYEESCLELETLCALAIIARTNGSWYASHPKSQFWAIDAQSINYEGLSYADDPIRQAIYDTQSMTLSQTGIYRGNASPFLARFPDQENSANSKDYAVAKISLKQANEMAQEGAHAAQILSKAFPGINIVLNR